MTPDQIKNGKIVIFSHYATTGACEELRDWLVSLKAREVVYVAFPFGSHRNRAIRVEQYSEGNVVKAGCSLFRSKLPEPLAYVKDFLYAFVYSIRFSRKADVLVAGDNLLALAGVMARFMSRARRVVYYMIDYSPVRYPNRLMNALYYVVDRQAAYHVDWVWPLTAQIIKGRIDAGRLEEDRVRWQTAPYGSHPIDEGMVTSHNVNNVVYMGDIVRNKGSELFVPIALELKRLLPTFIFTVIGGGKDLQSLRSEVARVGLQDHFVICGFVESIAEVLVMLAKGGIALAPYSPFDSNSFTFYSDPGKIKVYLGCGLPIVLTDVPPIAKMIEGEGAGRIARYDAVDIAHKIASLLQAPEYFRFRSNAARLGRQYEWGKVFIEAFARLDDACVTGRNSA